MKTKALSATPFAGVAHLEQQARAEARPISEIRASAGYRSHLVEVLVKRAVKKAVEQHRAGMTRSK